jgi:predicted transcriptional regulator
VLCGSLCLLLTVNELGIVLFIGTLAKALGRDYSNVHADVQALLVAGLLDATDGSVRADYDAIETKIAI